jgi:diadenosine tetraphosphate (Ap4A) HIT family hydrolase
MVDELQRGSVACPFCQIDPARLFLATDSLVGLWDAFPVSPGHALLVPRRHVATWFDASEAEQLALAAAVGEARALIEARCRDRGEPLPDGYNVGFNAGEAAGQTVFHAHVHVIPRYRGDNPSPRGGVRAVVPGKAGYRQ